MKEKEKSLKLKILEFTKKHPLLIFIIKRILIALPILIFVIPFALLGFMELAPGDYLSTLALRDDLPKELIEQQRIQFGLDKPFFIRYVVWVKNFLFEFDMGYSFAYRLPVVKLIGIFIWNSVLLNIVSLVLSVALAFPAGLWCALHPLSKSDKTISFTTFILMSTPSFFLALLAMLAAASSNGILPIGGLTSVTHSEMNAVEQVLDIGWHLILPVLVMTLGGVAGTIRYVRSTTINELNQQYIEVAKAKGLKEKTIVIRHALRNAINPFITGSAGLIAGLFSGSLLIEKVMNYPGIGRLMFSAVMQQDQPLILANMMFASTLTVIGLVVSDILLAKNDPRIRMK